MELLDQLLVSGFTLYIDLEVMKLLSPNYHKLDTLLRLLPIHLCMFPLLLWYAPLLLVELELHPFEFGYALIYGTVSFMIIGASATR